MDKVHAIGTPWLRWTGRPAAEGESGQVPPEFRLQREATRASAEVLLRIGEALRRYGFPDGHPLSVDRQQAFVDEARRRGLLAAVRVLPPRLARDDELLRFHTASYVGQVRRGLQRGQGGLDYGDTPCFPGLFEAAGAVAGTALEALSRVMAGEASRSFQPIGGLHHARRDAAAGFCAVNDVGVVIETLRRDHGVRRIAYVDIDVHHGDGVYYSYEDDPDLIVVDIHEDGRFLYPGTGHAGEHGTGIAAGSKLNLPLPPGAADAELLRAWAAAEAFLRAQRPQFLLMQCGVDSLHGDPLAHLCLTPAAHAHAAARLCRLANEMCAGRLMTLAAATACATSPPAGAPCWKNCCAAPGDIARRSAQCVTGCRRRARQLHRSSRSGRSCARRGR